MMNSSLDGGGEEDAEDSSSSSFNSATGSCTNELPKQFKSALDEFREKWQMELKSDLVNKKNHHDESMKNDDNVNIQHQQQQQRQRHRQINKNDHDDNSFLLEENDDEKRAKNYFMEGIELEKRGKVYDALSCYRRAVQIVPDIEFRIHEMTKKQQTETNNNIMMNEIQLKSENINLSTDTDYNSSNLSCSNSNDVEDLSNVDLRTRFQNDLMKNDSGKLIERINSNDRGLILTTGAHISDLPLELILYILRWVVSSQLDIRSLEQCSRVCKGLYLCARDEEIWKSACLKVWGVHTGSLKNSQYKNWRQMFIERYRINFNGCYISKTSYIRYGENSFQDQFYRPVQLIEYYRYIRFLTDGTVIMMTTADEPSQCVNKLNNLNQLRNDVLIGHYRLHGDLIIIILKRYKKSQNMTITGNYNMIRKRLQSANITSSSSSSSSTSTFGLDNNPIDNNMNNNNSTSSSSSSAGLHTFYIELKIINSKKRRFSQLQWKHYSIIQIKNKREIASDFELTPAKYPPFWFSRVKSYNLETDLPLK